MSMDIGNNSSGADSIINVVEKIIMRRRWELDELAKLEEKYKMKSREFYEAWRKGLLPEPENPETHGDFMVWAGLIEELEELEKELLKKVENIR